MIFEPRVKKFIDLVYKEFNENFDNYTKWVYDTFSSIKFEIVGKSITLTSPEMVMSTPIGDLKVKILGYVNEDKYSIMLFGIDDGKPHIAIDNETLEVNGYDEYGNLIYSHNYDTDTRTVHVYKDKILRQTVVVKDDTFKVTDVELDDK